MHNCLLVSQLPVQESNGQVLETRSMLPVALEYGQQVSRNPVTQSQDTEADEAGPRTSPPRGREQFVS